MKRIFACAVVVGGLFGCGGSGGGEGATEGEAAGWTAEVALPNGGGSASGVVGNNLMVASDNQTVMVVFPISGDGYTLNFAVSKDNGATWNGPIRIEPAAPGAFSVNAAMDAQDRAHVVWIERVPSERVYYAYSDDFGDSWSDAVPVSPEAERGHESALITVDGKMRVHVMWHDGDPSDPESHAEAFYARSPDGGATWDNPQQLSLDDEKNSAFPRADFTGATGDDLAIVWRDERGETHWDVYGAFSKDGGRTWIEKLVVGGTGDQWDPMSMVDGNGIVHVGIMEYPAGDYLNVRILYLRSENLGKTWSEAVELSEARSRFPFFAYDRTNDIVWLFWKDERDWTQEGQDKMADIAGKYSLDGGETWSSLEFVTNLGEIEVKLPAFAVGNDGLVRCVYSYAEEPDVTPESVYYTCRTSAP